MAELWSDLTEALTSEILAEVRLRLDVASLSALLKGRIKCYDSLMRNKTPLESDIYYAIKSHVAFKD